MSSRCTSWAFFTSVLVFIASCGSESGGANGALPPDWEVVCIDTDGDGYGIQCANGPDCDDTDKAVFENCAACVKPAAGCACESDSEPVDCVVSRTFQEDGSMLCRTGKMYCRDGLYTECLGVKSFEVPPPAVVMSQIGAVVDGDAAPVVCDACAPDCYRVDDNLETVTNEDGIMKNPSGGLTLWSEDTGAGVDDPDAVDPIATCTPGQINPALGQLDDDCDGIPDDYDDNTSSSPFATQHSAITFDLDPGEDGTHVFELQFFLNTVDVYFLIDTTGSMDGELGRLITDLTTGTFLDDPSTPVNEATKVVCASPPGSTTSDPTLKNKGIAGNIACLVPDSGFGAGFFREIPFVNADANGIRHTYDWFIPFEHRQDISGTVDDTTVALKKFPTAGNISWPEADIFALQAVATGEEIYTGWDRPGVPARTCPNPTKQFGWPCFRKEAVPVVVLITDAPMMNGPNVDVYNNSYLSSCSTDPWTFYGYIGSCSSNSQCVSSYGTGSVCYSSKCTCVTDANCTATAGAGYFCSAGRCVKENTVSSTCAPDGLADNVLSANKFGNSSNKYYPVNYSAANTNNMAVTPDRTYHPVTGNETFSNAYDVGDIGTSFKTYTGDTRGMTADIHLENLGTACSNTKWPTNGNAAAVSAATPGYPDAVFKFKVTNPNQKLTISTRGTHHAPTLAIVPVAAAGAPASTTVANVPVSGDTSPWNISGTDLGFPYDYSVNLNMSNYTGQLPRESFGSCMAGSGGTDYAPDAVFAFTPSSNVQGATFSTGATRVVAENTTAANTPPGVSLGVVNGQTVSYTGTTTTSTTSKWTGAQAGGSPYNTLGCRSASTTTGREHIFSFTVTNASYYLRMRLTAAFDGVLSVYGPSTTAPVAGQNIPNYLGCSRNSGGDEVLEGTLNVGTYYLVVTGYSSTLVGNYTLTISDPNATSEVIALFDAPPVAPTNANITGPGPAFAANTNDQFYDFNVGQIDGRSVRLIGGDTSASTIRPDYMASGFQAAGSSCSVVSGTSSDAVIDFSVGTTRKVRIETFDGTGTSSTMGAGFDHAVALIERPVQLSTVPVRVIDNDDPATAKVVSASTVPTAEGAWVQYEGATFGSFVPSVQPPATISNTVTMTPSIQSQEMYNTSVAASSTCNLVNSATQDSVYRFDVDASSAGNYDFDTVGSSTSTWLSVHKGSPDTFDSFTTPITNSTPATDNASANDDVIGAQSGVTLGTIDYRTVTYNGTTTTSTYNKWTDAQLGACRLNASGTSGRENVFNFTLTQARAVRIALTATSPFDPSVTLVSAQPTVGSSLAVTACSRTAGSVNYVSGGMSASNGIITGTLAAGTYYLVVHGYQASNNVGSYSLQVGDNTRQPRTVSTDDEVADGQGPTTPVALGNAARGQVTYTAASTATALDKWTQAQVSGATGTGCRTAGMDDGKEHVLSFTVTDPVSRNLRVTLTASGTYDPVLSIFNSGSVPVAGSSVPGLMACSRVLTTTAVNQTITSGFTASAGTITGSFAPGTYYVLVHAYAAANQTGSYTLNITDVDYTDVTIPSASLNTAAQGTAVTGAQAGADLGVMPRRLTYAGTTASTAPDKWTQAQVSPGGVLNGCRATGANAQNEHILRFTVPAGTGPRDLSIVLTRTSPFDPSLTLLRAQPTGSTSIGALELACTRVASSLNTEVPDLTAGFTVPTAGQIRGTFTAGQTYYLMVHGYTTSNNAGAYTLTITDNDKQSGGSTEIYATPYPRAVTVNNTQAEAVTGPQAGVDLGVVDDAVVSYGGLLTATDTHNKWTQVQVSRTAEAGSTGTGAPTGCRTSGNNTGREQILKFTVSQARALTLQLTRVSGGDPALSLFNGSAPVIATTVGSNLVACSKVSSSLFYAASGYNAATLGVISGTFAAGTYYLMVHASSANAVGSYALTITDGSYTTATSATDALLSNSSGPQPGVDLGTIDGVAVQYTGTTDSTTTNKWTGAKLSPSPYTGTGCRSSAANTVSYEHVFKFTVASARRVAVRLQRGGSYDPIISLFNGSVPTIGRNVDGLMACSRVITSTGQEHQTIDPSIAASNTGFITGTLAAGTYYLVVHAYSASNPTGTYQLNVQDVTPFHLGTANGRRMQVSGSTVGFINQWTGAQLLGPSGNGGRSGTGVRSPESVYSFTVSGSTAKTLTVSTVAVGTLDAVIGIYSAAAPIGGQNATNFINLKRNSGGYEIITQSFDPGTYYVVVHGYGTNATGTFNLEVRDDTWDDGLIACDSYGAASSLKNVALEAGNSYYVVVKGGVGPSNYSYKLNVRRSLNRPFIACDYQSLSTRRSYVEATLEGGKTYSVVLRGRTASDSGNYGVIIRDATVDTMPLGCANNAGFTGQGTDPTTFTTNLVGGKTYYMAVRSNSSGSVGAANVSVQSSAAMCEYDNVSVNYSNSTNMPAEMVRTFPVGEYYAVIKGRADLDTSSIGIPTGSGGIADDRGRGWYQITFGDATLQTTGQQFTPPAWGNETAGVQKELVSKGIRVITVNSAPSNTGNSTDNASDPYLRAQSVAMSTATGAIDTTGAAVRRTINPDGSGMGFAVVDAIAKFTQAVQMDISVRLSYDPDDPRTVAPYNRSFKFSSRAIPVAGNNGCAPPIDTDGNGTLDTFESCGPGATPRFEITVTNPKFPNNVPINPNNAGGGYLMRLELIGKDKLTANAAPQIVDTIPVYVIPANVLPDPNIEFEPQGTYTQTVSASGCTGASERPIWRGLYFTDTLPPGTSMEWRLCGGDNDTELDQCNSGGFRTLATVTPGDFCSVSGDCGQFGYCNQNGRCEYAVGPTCLANADCGRQGKCDAGRCKWTSNPSVDGIDVKAALAGGYANKKRMRVQVELFANQTRDKAPTVHDFRIDYVCQQYE